MILCIIDRIGVRLLFVHSLLVQQWNESCPWQIQMSCLYGKLNNNSFKVYLYNCINLSTLICTILFLIHKQYQYTIDNGNGSLYRLELQILLFRVLYIIMYTMDKPILFLYYLSKYTNFILPIVSKKCWMDGRIVKYPQEIYSNNSSKNKEYR